jgi:hypothetical protein
VTYSVDPSGGVSRQGTISVSASGYSVVFTVTQSDGPDFLISVTQTPSQVRVDGSGTYIIYISKLNGFTGNVAFSVSGLPAGTSATFNPSPNPAPPFMVITTTAGTPPGAYSLTLTGTSGSLTHQATGIPLVVSSSATVLGPNTELHQNLGPVPFDFYSYSASASLLGPGVCPPSAQSVRACYQAIFANYRAQGVTGVRFQFGMCGGGSSTPLLHCDEGPSGVGFDGTNWLPNVNSFFADLYNAGIYNVTLTPEFSDWMGTNDQNPGHYLAPTSNNPNDPNPTSDCSGQPVLQFWPALPYGQIGLRRTGAPSGVPAAARKFASPAQDTQISTPTEATTDIHSHRRILSL